MGNDPDDYFESGKKTVRLCKEVPLNNRDVIPVHDLNTPDGGPQKECAIGDDTPVYSSYTGKLIKKGPIGRDVTCDAPEGHKNHGKNYRSIKYNPANDSYMASKR